MSIFVSNVMIKEQNLEEKDEKKREKSCVNNIRKKIANILTIMKRYTICVCRFK